jgi:hypothetical protein
MKNNKTNGFAAPEAVLILVIVAMISGVGWYVYNSQKQTKQSLDNANKSLTDISQQKKDEKKTEPKEEESWFEFTPPSKAYSVRVPDGWSGISLDNNLYIRDPGKFIYVKGTAATVQVLQEGGWDGPSPFALYYPRENADQIVRLGKEQGTFKTDAGITVHKYYYVQETDPQEIGYSKGDKVYHYYFDEAGKFIEVSHVVSTGQPDQSALVERMIKTISVK